MPPPPPAPGGVAPKFGSEKVSRYTGVSQLQLRVSRYTVQLSIRKSCRTLSLRIFWGYFLPRKLILFSEVIFKDPPKMSFKNKHKNNLARFFFLRLFFYLPREVISKKNLKRFLGFGGADCTTKKIGSVPWSSIPWSFGNKKKQGNPPKTPRNVYPFRTQKSPGKTTENGEPARPLQRSLGPSWPEMPKKSRDVSRHPAPGTPESLQRVPEHSKNTFTRHFPETLRRLAGLSRDFCPD